MSHTILPFTVQLHYLCDLLAWNDLKPSTLIPRVYIAENPKSNVKPELAPLSDQAGYETYQENFLVV